MSGTFYRYVLTVSWKQPTGREIKIITHSMGAAFSRGYMQGIQQWANVHKKSIIFEYILDVESYEGALVPNSPLNIGPHHYKLGQRNWFPPPGGVAPPQDAINITNDLDRKNAVGSASHSIDSFNQFGIPYFGNGGKSDDIEQGVNNATKPK